MLAEGINLGSIGSLRDFATIEDKMKKGGFKKWLSGNIDNKFGSPQAPQDITNSPEKMSKYFDLMLEGAQTALKCSWDTVPNVVGNIDEKLKLINELKQDALDNLQESQVDTD